MTFSITALDQPDALPSPRMRLHVESTALGNDLLSLTRIHSDATRHAVITERGARLSSGFWTGFDYLCPLSAPVVYELTSCPTLPLPVTPALLLEGTRPWLANAIDPTMNVGAIYAETFGDDAYTFTVGAFDVIGTQKSISVTDGTGHNASSVLLGLDVDTLPAARALMATGAALLLNVPVAHGWDATWRWIAPTSATFSVPNTTGRYGSAGWPYRMLALPYVEVLQPVVDLSPVWNCRLAAEEWITCYAMSAGYLTVTGLATDTRGS